VSDDGVVREERLVAAAPVEVWRAVTTAQALAGWFWPDRFATEARVDLRVGGQYRIASPVAGIAVSGRYTEVRGPGRLGFTWQWDGEDVESEVLVELARAETGTGLTLTHRGLAATEIANHAKGWSDCLDRLPGWLVAD
jgi:uncharacterized protein YndB with AHSA1/START domain